MEQRKYQETHPWISFSFNPMTLGPGTLIKLGEALSKCDHVSGAPLPPSAAQELNKVSLTKGIHATTSIEGNTLTEEEVEKRIDGKLTLPDSLEYQGAEIDNLLEILNEIANLSISQELPTLSIDLIKSWNKRILQDQPLGEDVTPGEFRYHSVVVGEKDYRGAPAEDCPYLMDRFISFITEELQTDDATWHKPLWIIRPIIAHLYFAWIHPFGDGNGRTARLIELYLLLKAGIPIPSAHILSDYYNRSRGRYYQALKQASRTNNYEQGMANFIDYAVTGFVEGLQEQVASIENIQIHIAWESFINQTIAAHGHNETWARRRTLARNLPYITKGNVFIRKSNIRYANTELAKLYEGKSQKTMTRDLNALVECQLARQQGDYYASNIELMKAFLPHSGNR
jgi:filamentation induced by cAMP protein fic